MCFVDFVFCKDFDRVPRKVLKLAMRKKIIPDVFGGSVRNLHKEAKKRVSVDPELAEEFEAKLGMHQGSALSSFNFSVVVDVLTELARDGVLSELLYVIGERWSAERIAVCNWRETEC